MERRTGEGVQGGISWDCAVVFFGTRDRDNWEQSETSLQLHAIVWVETLERQETKRKEPKKEKKMTGKEEAGKGRRESGEWNLSGLQLTLSAWQVCSRSHAAVFWHSRSSGDR